MIAWKSNTCTEDDKGKMRSITWWNMIDEGTNFIWLYRIDIESSYACTHATNIQVDYKNDNTQGMLFG